MNNSKPVILYGAGTYANIVFDELNKKYDPVAFCDSDKKKWGQQLRNLPVISLDEALSKYPDCLFYVTVYGATKFDVINTLIQNGINSERIINFEKIKKYKSCRWLETYMLLSDDNFRFCCSDFGRNKSPMVKFGSNIENALEDFVLTRDRIIEELNNPELVSPNESKPCIGCYEVKEAFWAENRHMRKFIFDFDSICNFKCSYCYAFNEKKDVASEKIKKSIEAFKYLEEHNLINKNTEIEIASGEISVNPLRNEVLSMVEDYPVYFYTNAGVFNDKIAEIISKGRSKIVSSVDAGTRETFYKIKGVDIFDKVCENLRKYSEHGFVELKYIFLPGINDNMEDVEGFANLCKNTNVLFVDITRNFHDMNPLSDHTLEMITYFIKKMQDLKINFLVPDWIFAGSDDYEKINRMLLNS